MQPKPTAVEGPRSGTERSPKLGSRRIKRSKIGFKLRSIFLPYVLTSIGILAVSSALHWLLTARSGELRVDETVVCFVMPCTLSGGAIGLWLRHRLRLLKWRRRDPFFGYVIAWLLISFPTVLAQHYLETALGALTHLGTIDQIDEVPRTKFYIVDTLDADKAHAQRKVRTWSSGRGNQYWEMEINYATPLRDSRTAQTRAWLGLRYHRQVSGRLGQDQRRSELDAFLAQTARKFSEDDFGWVTYLETAGSSAEKRALEQAITDNSTNMQPRPREPILIARGEPFASRNGSVLGWSLGVLAGGWFVWLLLVLFLSLDSARYHAWAKGELRLNQDFRTTAAFLLVPRRDFIATPLLIEVNLLVWAAMAVCGVGLIEISPADLLPWGAIYRPRIEDGEIWRLFTALFVHIGPLHLANNLLALLLLGLAVEHTFGTGWFTAVYLITGIVSGVASMRWHSNTVIAGASGSIFGVAGFGLALLLVKAKRFAAMRPTLLKIAGIYLGINLVFGAIIPGVDLVAHIAGLIVGGFLGLAASPLMKEAGIGRASGR